ncbi:hypothetical protein, partial [Mycobacterium sp. DBP42]|uniref:hypothetical protein n=1 Tax=Mycobacterium sp. DBP42 TaxID=2545267 RepID=UPI002017EE6B
PGKARTTWRNRTIHPRLHPKTTPQQHNSTSDQAHAHFHAKSGLALLARLEACGRIEGRYLNTGLLGDWAQLAQLCPTMVANDLLIAEAAVLYGRRGDLTGDDE